MSANLWRPPTPRCTSDFGACRGAFKRIRSKDPDEADTFECKKCGDTFKGRMVTPTELRLAQCRTCKEPFLWKYEHRQFRPEDQRAPSSCRACNHEARAKGYESAAARHRAKGQEARAQQRRAVAKFKPAEAQVVPGGQS